MVPCNAPSLLAGHGVSACTDTAAERSREIHAVQKPSGFFLEKDHVLVCHRQIFLLRLAIDGVLISAAPRPGPIVLRRRWVKMCSKTPHPHSKATCQQTKAACSYLPHCSGSTRPREPPTYWTSQRVRVARKHRPAPPAVSTSALITATTHRWRTEAFDDEASSKQQQATESEQLLAGHAPAASRQQSYCQRSTHAPPTPHCPPPTAMTTALVGWLPGAPRTNRHGGFTLDMISITSPSPRRRPRVWGTSVSISYSAEYSDVLAVSDNCKAPSNCPMLSYEEKARADNGRRQRVPEPLYSS